MSEFSDQLLTQKQVAQWIGMSEAWLEQCRFRKKGLPWVKIGKSCRYRKSDVAKWIEANVVATGI
jgi:predicted DNA-binding transcriptional regulator AlpA